MPRLHISPKIIKSIATLYNDANRIFMEYIDNSLDSATELFDEEKNRYSRPIEITVTIEGGNYKNGKVIISDNCLGITNFTKIVESVGYSDKIEKAQPWINGQFGYGIYSFMAASQKLEITSKTKDADALYMPIESHQFDAKKIEDVLFPEPKQYKKFEHESGTKIVLSHFDKDSWKQVDIIELKNEIEKHFELLLSRKNLAVKLVHSGSSVPDKDVFVCKPFDYDQYEGAVYEVHRKEMRVVSGRKHKKIKNIQLKKPIHIFLKITKGKEINKRPVFICKGRRIGEIKDIKSFKSKHKSDIWDHPNVTGYIDLSDFLGPTIARNDFKNNDHSRALFSFLLELEPEILDVIKDVNKQSEERHYQELEDRLNQVLSQLARVDAMNFRTDYLSGSSLNLERGGTGQRIENGRGAKDRGNMIGEGLQGDGLGENEGEGLCTSGHIGDIPGGDLGGEGAINKEPENPFEDTGFKGGEKKKAGFNIRIVDTEPPVDSADKLLRSTLAGSEIRIFKQHSDFQERVDMSRRGETRITQRLITYLAGEITVHYKDKFHTKQKEQPEYNKAMFTDSVGFVYQFETMLKDLAGKNLSDLGN